MGAGHAPAGQALHRVAPDLLGHGQSAKPRGDYSLGAYASGVRDLLVALGHERATVVGHSLGGGVAMQLAYQFPERCERLVLVGSGGLGREVSLLLRAATLPGSEFVLPVLTHPGCSGPAAPSTASYRFGLELRTDIKEMARGHATLADREARSAFVHTLRTIVDPGGQRVNATGRLYLAEHVPFLLIWGARDPIIPLEHGRRRTRRCRAASSWSSPGRATSPSWTIPSASSRCSPSSSTPPRRPSTTRTSFANCSSGADALDVATARR